MNLMISARYLPPMLTDQEVDNAHERMCGRGVPEPDEPFLETGDVTIFGKIGMIMCWYFDGQADQEYDLADATRLVSLIPTLLAGEFGKLKETDLFQFIEALGAFPQRDRVLDWVYTVLRQEYNRRTRDGKYPLTAKDILGPD